MQLVVVVAVGPRHVLVAWRCVVERDVLYGRTWLMQMVTMLHSRELWSIRVEKGSGIWYKCPRQMRSLTSALPSICAIQTICAHWAGPFKFLTSTGLLVLLYQSYVWRRGRMTSTSCATHTPTYQHNACHTNVICSASSFPRSGQNINDVRVWRTSATGYNTNFKLKDVTLPRWLWTNQVNSCEMSTLQVAMNQSKDSWEKGFLFTASRRSAKTVDATSCNSYLHQWNHPKRYLLAKILVRTLELVVRLVCYIIELRVPRCRLPTNDTVPRKYLEFTEQAPQKKKSTTTAQLQLQLQNIRSIHKEGL